MGMGQNPGTFCEPQVIAGIYGCEYPTNNAIYRYWPIPILWSFNVLL